MAKWKNALLISTIVAPIAFGASPLGDVLAAPDTTDYTARVTDVTVHKYLNTKGGAENQNHYWGDGSALTNGDDATDPSLDDVFGSTDGWEQANDEYEFTAYLLPGNAISGYNDGDKPAISSDSAQFDDTTNVFDGKTYSVTVGDVTSTVTINDWADILTAVEGAADKETTGPNKSAWTIEVKPELLKNATFVADFQKFLGDNQGSFVGKDDADSETAGYQLETDTNGELTFQDLPKNEWIIFETGEPAGVKAAVPMVLNLPMLKSTATDPQSDSSWYGSRTTDTTITGDAIGTPAVNLYPKNYTTNPNLKVAKVDQNGDKISGAEFVSFDWNASTGTLPGPAGLQADLNAGAEYTKEEDPANPGSFIYAKATASSTDAKTLAAYSTDEVTELLKQVYGIVVLQTGETSDTDGTFTFSTGLKVHGTYGILETKTDANYDEVSGLRQITLDTADSTDNKTGDGEDGHVFFNGSTYEVTNLPGSTPDKKINVDAPTGDDPAGSASANFNFSNFKNDDYTLGVTRGEHFQYTVDTDYNKNIANNVTADTGADGAEITQTGYDTFKIIDTMDPEIDITDFTVGTYVGTTYTPLVKYQIEFYNTKTSDWEPIATDGGFSGNYTQLRATVVENYQNIDLTGVQVTVTPADYPSTAATVPDTAKGATITFELLPGLNTADTVKDLSTNAFAQKMAALAGDSGEPELRMLMNAQLNSAATEGTINNNVKATVKPVYGQPKTPGDDSKTFTAGWEFIKTDGSSEVLAGAGFDLSRKMVSADMQTDRLLNGASGISKFTDNKDGSGDLTAAAITRLNSMADLLAADDKKSGEDWTGAWKQGPGTNSKLDQAETALQSVLHSAASDDRAAKMYAVLQNQSDAFAVDRVLYFAHLDKDGLPEAEMRDTSEMGDVLWTIYPEFATTHYSDDHGYFQYCGLASGPYTLTEVVAPSGYSATNKVINFYLGNGELPTDIPATEPTDKDSEEWAAWKQNQDYQAAKVKDPSLQLLLAKYTDDNIDGPQVAATDPIAMISAGKAVEVPNAQKSIFPLVGGIGAMFAVIAGLLAMGLALLKRKKDMKNEA